MTGTSEGWIDLTGKLALVTGAAAGIGRASAMAMASAGAVTIVLDRDEHGAAQAANAIQAAGGRAIARQLDVTSEPAWHDLADWLEREWGRVDILVNCAGIARFDRVDEAMFETYREVFGVNVDGTLFGMTMALRFMRKTGQGAIVNISSTASLKGNPAMASYGASKAAVSHFTRSAALETNRAGLDIRINAVLPGFTDTAMAQAVHDRFDEKLGGHDKTLAIFSSGRAAQPEEIANLVLFLASERASFVSGSTISIDRAQGA
ncbi:SDR family oxidoreductase [Novosphingobium sp. G106]|uniref:SDR family NAD(P)-dependent oxidoreductase n=1 Tax=Novosphingobium sp. G106 TaxID=2849500 RepID=UPI001C2D1B92|nr:SDR family oxidoreductase [Novosphingobium sp. G106]MBV1686195.1 SDR family oxidoreductase [Novosphingobium sp. G106]